MDRERDRLKTVRLPAGRAVPPETRVPNAETIAAIDELERGGGERFVTIAAFMADLNADD